MTLIVRNCSDIPYHQGEHAVPGLRFRFARQALGVSAWGMNVIDFDPGCDRYPEHDHVHDGQEEVYVVLAGSIVLIAEGKERVLGAGDIVRVSAETARKFVTRESAATLLAIGGTPGRAYAGDPAMDQS